MKIKLTFYAILFFIINISAQVEKDSSNFAINPFLNKLFENSFNKQLNTHSFGTQLNYSIVTKNFFLGLNENFRSTIIKATDKNIKDEQFLHLLGQYDLAKKLKIGLTLNNNIYSDNRQIAINKSTVLNLSPFLKYVPINNINITLYGGPSSNTQVNKKDNGLIYGSEANIEKQEFGEFEISSLLKFQNEDISPRKNTFRQLNFDLNNTFERNFKNSITANLVSQRKDFIILTNR